MNKRLLSYLERQTDYRLIEVFEEVMQADRKRGQLIHPELRQYIGISPKLRLDTAVCNQKVESLQFVGIEIVRIDLNQKQAIEKAQKEQQKLAVKLVKRNWEVWFLQ